MRFSSISKNRAFAVIPNFEQLNRRVGELRRDLSESCTPLQMEELDAMASSLWRFTLASITFCAIFTVAIAEQCRRIVNDVRDFSRMCYFERVRFFDLTSPVKLVLFAAVVAWTWNRNDRASDRHSSASYSHASEVGSRASLSSSASDLGLVEPLTHGDSGDQTV
jgi:hypothetical protein